MPGFQPRMKTDPVWWNGSNVNTFDPGTGVGIKIDALRGWDERVDVRDVREPRHGQDGEHADNVFLGGRSVTIEGTVYGSTWANLQSRKRALVAVFTPMQAEVLMKVPDPATAAPTATYAATGMTGYERISARVVESILFGDMHGPAAQSFQVIVRASDPRIYSDVETVANSSTSGSSARTVTVDQSGTYPTPLTITTTGPSGSIVSVSSSDESLFLQTQSLTLAAAQTIRAETRDRTIDFTGSYAEGRMLESPIALWMLGETSGTTADNYQGTAAYDGTYTGGFALNQPGFASGLPSVDLNGSTGYISVPYNAGLFPTISTTLGAVEGLSFEAWVNFDSLTGTQTLIDSISSNRGYRVQIVDGTDLVVARGNGSTVNTLTRTGHLSGRITTGSWVHLYFSMTNSVPASSISASIAINGVSLGSGFQAGEYTPQTSGGVRLGATLSGSSFLNGRVSAVALYSKLFSSVAAVSRLYEASANGSDVSVYGKLDAASARWANLGTDSTTYTLSSTGLASGSKLSVSYRNARL